MYRIPLHQLSLLKQLHFVPHAKNNKGNYNSDLCTRSLLFFTHGVWIHFFEKVFVFFHKTSKHFLNTSCTLPKHHLNITYTSTKYHNKYIYL